MGLDTAMTALASITLCMLPTNPVLLPSRLCGVCRRVRYRMCAGGRHIRGCIPCGELRWLAALVSHTVCVSFCAFLRLRRPCSKRPPILISACGNGVAGRTPRESSRGRKGAM